MFHAKAVILDITGAPEREVVIDTANGEFSFKPEAVPYGRLYLAERFQVPVMITSDLYLAERLEELKKLMVREVNARLADRNLSVELTPKAVERMAEIGFDPAYGARPLRRAASKWAARPARRVARSSRTWSRPAVMRSRAQSA